MCDEKFHSMHYMNKHYTETACHKKYTSMSKSKLSCKSKAAVKFRCLECKEHISSDVEHVCQTLDPNSPPEKTTTESLSYGCSRQMSQEDKRDVSDDESYKRNFAKQSSVTHALALSCANAGVSYAGSHFRPISPAVAQVSAPATTYMNTDTTDGFVSIEATAVTSQAQDSFNISFAMNEESYLCLNQSSVTPVTPDPENDVSLTSSSSQCTDYRISPMEAVQFNDEIYYPSVDYEQNDPQ